MSEQEPATTSGPDDNAELVDRLEEEAETERTEKAAPDAAGSDTTGSVPGAPEPPD